MKVFLRLTKGLFEFNDGPQLHQIQKTFNLPVTDTFGKSWKLDVPEFTAICDRLKDAGGSAIGISDGISESEGSADPTPRPDTGVEDNQRRDWYEAAGKIAKERRLSVSVFIDNEEYIYTDYVKRLETGVVPMDSDDYGWLRARREQAWVDDTLMGLERAGADIGGVTLYGWGRAIPQVRNTGSGPAISGWGKSGNVGAYDRVSPMAELVSGEVFFWQYPDIMAATLAHCMVNARSLPGWRSMSVSHWILRARKPGGPDIDLTSAVKQYAAGKMYRAFHDCIDEIWCHLAPVSSPNAFYKLLWAQELRAFLGGLGGA